jgi:hypothetical protein
MDSEKKDFDGSLIVFLDERELPLQPETVLISNSASNNVVYFPQEDPNANVIRLLAAKRKIEIAKNIEVPDFVKECAEEIFRDRYDAFRRKYGKEIADIIVSGKLKVSLLLDAMEGNGVAADHLIQATRNVLSQKGEVHAYVPRGAYNVGTRVFEAASHRYATAGADIQWHSGALWIAHEDPASKGGMTADFAEQEMDEMRSFFEENAKEEAVPVITAKIDKAEQDPENHDNTVQFSGLELHRYGIVHEVTFDITGLMDLYGKKNPSSPAKTEGMPFFEGALTADQMEQQSGQLHEASEIRKKIRKCAAGEGARILRRMKNNSDPTLN